MQQLDSIDFSVFLAVDRDKVAMKFLQSFLFSCIIFSVARIVECHDDIECEKQLDKFEDSLEKRESWAVRRNFCYFLTFQIFLSCSLFKFPTCGQIFLPGFSTETSTAPVILQNVSSSDTMTSNINTAW